MISTRVSGQNQISCEQATYKFIGHLSLLEHDTKIYTIKMIENLLPPMHMLSNSVPSAQAQVKLCLVGVVKVRCAQFGKAERKSK